VTRREWGVWLGVVAGALGWLLTLATLARGGGYLVVVPRLATVLPLAVVGTVTALGAFGVARKWVNGVLWLGVLALFGVFWNFLVYWAHFGAATWGLLLPLARPTGVDFRDGLYLPGKEFTTVHSGWPPLTVLLGRLLGLFGFSVGHAVELVLLVLAALAAVVLSALLAQRALAGDTPPRDLEAVPAPRLFGLVTPRVTAVQVGVVAGLWLLTSYGFMYEMERGNIDLFALFFSLLAVWLLVDVRRSPWWPALALAVATNLKLYPGVLLVVLFWRYRWKAVAPVVVTNAVLLLIAGPRNLADLFVGQATIQSLTRGLWWGNHSAAALANVLHQVDGWPRTPAHVLFLAVPLALWVATLVVLVRRGWATRSAVLAAAACVPVMSVVPSISHDYKLVLCVFPLAVLVAFVAALPRRDLLVWSLVFGLLAWAMVQLSRSSLVTAPSFLSSKYAMILLVQALLLYVSWRTVRQPDEVTETATPAAVTRRADAAAPDGAAEGLVAGSDDTEPDDAGGGPAAGRPGGWLSVLTGTAPAKDGADGGVGADTGETDARAGAPLAWPTRRMVCVVLLLAAAALGADFWVGIIHNTFDDDSSAVGVPQHDFFQYYAGGHNWMLGVDPYVNHPNDPRVMHQPRPNYPEISGYIYPPTVLPLFGALSRWSYQAARTAWLAINVSAFALLILAAVAVSKGRRLEALTAAVILTMVSFAFFYHVHEGQIDMIIAALSVGAFLLYPRWKGWPSAALLALAVSVKVSPILLVAVICLYFRDWRFLLKVAVCGVVVAAGTLAFVDAGLWREYVVKILPTISGSDPSPFNQTPLRFWYKYPLAVKAGSALGYAALLFLAWVAGRNSRRVTERERRVDLRTERSSVLLLAVVLMLLFSPLAWQMAFVWVIVPLALVLTGTPPRGKEWAVLLLAVGAALLSMRMWPYRVLDMTNMIGAAVAAVCLLLYYLPLDLEKLSGARRAARDGDEPTASADGEAG
jgi:hypothetical protein